MQSLGQHTYRTQEAVNLNNYNMPSWVHSLSFGGLVAPSKEWLLQVQTMENIFIELHKETFFFLTNVVEKTTEHVAKKMNELPFVLVKSFYRQRIFEELDFKMHFVHFIKSSENTKNSRFL